MSDIDKIKEKIDSFKAKSNAFEKPKKGFKRDRHSDIILNFSINLILCSLIGYLLDKQFDMKPFFLLIFIFFSLISGLVQIYKGSK